MNKKIGILTFFKDINYGAVLQCFCLYKQIKALGYDVEIINYKTHNIFSLFSSILKGEDIKPCLSLIKFKLMNFIRLYKSLSFLKKHIKITKPISSINDPKLAEYDAIIFGSDQIWNYNIVNKITVKELNNIFYGNLNTKPSCIKISYAASAGAYEKEFINDAQKLSFVSKFNYISIREKTLQLELEKKLNTNIFNVIDPTLLVEPNILESLINNKFYKKEYVLLYKMLPSETIDLIASDYANKLNAPLIEITNRFIPQKLFKTHNHQFESIENFLAYIRNAKLILTTSFHGVALAITFNKNFYFISSDNKAENRIISLLTQLGLTNHIIKNIAPEPNIAFNNYHSTNTLTGKKLKEFRKSSMLFLENALTNQFIKQYPNKNDA